MIKHETDREKLFRLAMNAAANATSADMTERLRKHLVACEEAPSGLDQTDLACIHQLWDLLVSLQISISRVQNRRQWAEPTPAPAPPDEEMF